MKIIAGILCLGFVFSVQAGERAIFPKYDMEQLQKRYEERLNRESWMPLHIVHAARDLACLGDQRAKAFLVTVFMIQPVADTHCMRGSLEEQAQKVEIGFKVALGYRDLGIVNVIQILRDTSLEDLEAENPFIIKK